MARPNPERRYTTVPSLYSTGWGFVNNFNRSADSFYRAWNGVNTPGFFTKKRRDLPVNHHTVHIVKFEQRTFTRDRKKLGGQDWETDSWTDGISQVPRPNEAASLYDSVPDWSALNLALSRVQDEVLDRKANFLQFAAERLQTANLVHDTARRLANAIRQLRRGNLSGIRRALGYSGGPRRLSGSLANDWLAFQYGWKPLLSDVKGAAEHLAQNHLGRPLRLRVQKSGKGSTDGIPMPQANPGFSYWIRGVTTTQFKVYLEYEVSNDFIRQGSQLGLTDPLTLAWELVPWSFVADWFIPVGDFLSRLNFDSGLAFKKGGYTCFNRTENKAGIFSGIRDRQESDGLYRETWHAGDVATSDVIYMFRNPYSSSPTAKFPVFQDPFSPTRALNAIALLRSSFR